MACKNKNRYQVAAKYLRMMIILLKQLVRKRTDINLRPSESMRCVAICNQLASQLASYIN